MSALYVARRDSQETSEAEQKMREDLAAAYRMVAYYGMDDSIYTHISARVPGHDDQFLINPFGMLFRDITASSLVKIDLDGKIIGDSPYDVNPAGFTIHSAVHSERHDATCVLHTPHRGRRCRVVAKRRATALATNGRCSSTTGLRITTTKASRSTWTNASACWPISDRPRAP